MKKIREILKLDINDPYTLYTNDLYNLTVACQIKKESISKLNELYQNLPIHSTKEIVLNGKDIAKVLNKTPGDYIKNIINNLEKLIVYNKISNNKEDLEKYILENYNNIK